MDLIYIVIVSLICLLVIFFLYEKITNSRAWRIRSTVRTFQKEKKAEQNRIDKFKQEADEIITDENKLLKIIEKIHKGEEVEIPLAAFDFIYRKINSISVVDKNGKIKILNSKSFEDFQKTAINLIHKSEPEIFDEVVTPTIEQNKSNKLYEITKFDNGSMIKKNLHNGDFMMVTPSGKKYHNSFENYEMIVELSQEEKDELENKNNKKDNKQTDKVNIVKNDSVPGHKIEKDIKDLKQKQAIDFNNMLEKIDSVAKALKNKMKEETPSKINVAIERDNFKESEINCEDNIDINIEKPNIQNQSSNEENILIGSVGNNQIKELNDKENEKDVMIQIPTNVQNINETFEKPLTINTKETESKLNEDSSCINNDSSENKLVQIESNKNVATEKNITKNEDISSQKSGLQIVETKSNLNSFSELDELDNIFNKYEPTKKKDELVNNNDSLSEINKLIDDAKKITIFDKEVQTSFVEKLEFNSLVDIENEILSYGNVFDFLIHLVTISDYKYLNNFIHVPDKNSLFISIEIFIFKIYCNLSENSRDAFLNICKPSSKNNNHIDTDVIFPLVVRMNKSFGINYGVKPFYVNEENEIFYVEKYLAYIESEQIETKYFKGKFLKLNLNNSIGERLKENGYLDKFESNYVYEETVTTDKYFNLLSFEKIVKGK